MEVSVLENNFFSAAFIAIVLSAIPLVTSMVVGFTVSILQAATQIQEQTLTFVPKLAAVSCVLFFCGRWMCYQIIDYFTVLLESLPSFSLGG